MNVYLEIFGYIGTILVVSSMMMKSMQKLRVVNLIGGLISMIYSAFIVAWPLVLMNASIVSIHAFHLINGALIKRKSVASAQ